MSSEKSMQRVVDADHPWLGLTPFTPQTKEYFFGRDREIRDLFLRTREQPLTILYGQSGLGKTSLLGAGLIPKLEVEGYRPCLIRLGYEASDLSVLDQTTTAIRRTLRHYGQYESSPLTDSTAPGSTMLLSPEVSLWEFFHHLSFRPKSLEENPPVIIFDQFEEIFTLTDTPDRQRESQDLFRQLADLIENRPPQSVQNLLRENRRLAREYDLSASSVRVVITLREDYLSQLEAWKKQLPSLMRNRVGLRQLDGSQALEAVVRPGRREGRNLVSDDVATSIVRFVAKKPADTPLEEIGAVPPLLSLLCDELNESRLVAKASMVTAEQVQSQSSDILQNFYLRSFDNLSGAVRTYVEDRMVTIGGHRNPVAREDALSELAAQGVSSPSDAIDQLIQGRLLSSEERGGVQRLEITHDVLAPLVVHSRDQRRVRERAEKAEREQEASRRERRRLQRIAGAMIALTLLALVGTAIAIYSTYNAMRQEAIAKKSLDQAAKSFFDFAQSEFEAGRFSSATEKLERAWRLRFEKDPLKRNYALWLVNRKSFENRLIAQLHHSSVVSSLAFSPDGTRVATGSSDNTARLWSTASGAAIGVPMQHGDSVNCVAFSPDGTYIATGSSDNTVQLWDGATGSPIGIRMQHEGRVNSVAFSADGTRVATASYDDTACLWDATSGAQIATMFHEGEVRSVAFSPDGTRVATDSNDYKARLWDAVSGASIGEPMQHGDWVYALAFSPDGTCIATGSSDNTARLWNAASGTPISKPIQHNHIVSSVAFSSDGCRLATGCHDKTARLWNVLDGSPIGQPMTHEDTVGSVAFSPDGTYVATGSWDKTARLWDATTGAPIGQPMQHEDWVYSVAFSPDGTRVATSSRDFTAGLWDASIGRDINRPMRYEGGVISVAFSADGTRVATGLRDGVMIWETKTGTPIGKPLQTESEVNIVAFSPDGTRLATGSWDDTVRLWDTLSGTPIGKPMQHKSFINSLAFSPDGTRLATGTYENTANLWDATKCEPIGRPMQHDGSVIYVAFSPDGTHIATGSTDATARFWDAANCNLIGKPMRHEGPVLTVAFSADGPRVATGSRDYTARIWETASGTTIGQPMQHEESVNSVAFSHEGTQVVTGSIDNSFRRWDAATGAPIGEPIQLEGNLGALVICPVGNCVATILSENSVRLWDTASGAPIGQLMRHDATVDSLVISPDGTRVATISSDGFRLWDAELVLPNSIEAFLNRYAKEYDPTIPRDLEYEAAIEALRLKRLLRNRKSTVAKAIQDKNWFVAGFHLPALMKDEPDEAKWKVMWQETQRHLKAKKAESR